MVNTFPHALVLVVWLVIATPLLGQAPRQSSVGMPTRWDQVILPGTELEALPGSRKDALVLRIVKAFPHGTDWRYDLEFYGLEAGTFDLRKYLRRKDGSALANLPELAVTIISQLPAGQVEPHDLPTRPGPWLSGYRLALGLAGAVWVLGLALLLFWRRRKKHTESDVSATPLTLAQRLRPLVEKAQAGALSSVERASLERMLLAFWRERLQLGEVKPVEAFRRLRQHAEAGPLVNALESWLHRPNPEQHDLNTLLAPYASAEKSD